MRSRAVCRTFVSEPDSLTFQRKTYLPGTQMNEPLRFVKSEADQECVHSYFDSVAPEWLKIYERSDVSAVVHQQRQMTVLSLIDKLALPRQSRVLDAGCGAGLTSVALAERGYSVDAVDVASPMLDLTHQVAKDAGVAGRIRTSQGDVRDLPFSHGVFSLAVAIGVLPWVRSLDRSLRELVRVLRPGGYLIVNVDNRWRMTHLLDPYAWVKLAGSRIMRSLGFSRWSGAPPTVRCSLREFDALLAPAGLRKLWGATLGFGPFLLLDALSPQSAGVALHHRLQRLADRAVPLFRSAGAQYLVLSRKA